jgi:hypothetical protein
MINDVTVILWKEYRDSSRQKIGTIGLFLFFAVSGGLVAPWSVYREPTPQYAPVVMLDWVTLLTAFFYAGFVSEASFFEERSNGTLQALLTTSVRPVAVFLGKWLWFMTQATAMIVFVFSCQRMVELGFWISGRPLVPLGFAEVANSAVVGLFSWTLCSFVIAANAVLSLVMSDMRLGRLMGGFIFFVPFLGAYAFHKFLGVEWDRTMVWMVGGLCVLLSVVWFLGACLAFRFEYTRACR